MFKYEASFREREKRSSECEKSTTSDMRGGNCRVTSYLPNVDHLLGDFLSFPPETRLFWPLKMPIYGVKFFLETEKFRGQKFLFFCEMSMWVFNNVK